MTSTSWPRLLVLVTLLIAAGGCTSLRRGQLTDQTLGESKRLSSEYGLPITGYSTPDGVFHGFDGTARWTSSAHDSLELKGKRTGDVPGAEPSGDVHDRKSVTLYVARSDVSTLLYRGGDPSKSAVLGLSLVGIVVAMVTVIAVGAVALESGH